MAASTLPVPEVVHRRAHPRRGPNVETVLYLLLLILAIVTRFAMLDAMALHHDEGIHALFGWNIYRGYGWVHDAVYHGPLIYHAAALSYFLFGDSDATFRLILAVFGTATVMLPVLLRRYLGRWGALLAAFLLLISPTFLYFGRFGHPDVFGAFFTLLFFVCVVRYIGEGRNLWLYGAGVATCLHFCAKPTAYLVTAVFLLFLMARVLWERYGLHAFWPLLGLFPAALEDLWQAMGRGALLPPLVKVFGFPLSALSLAFLLATGAAVLVMLALYLWECRRAARSNPSLDLVVLLLALVLPLLSAVPLNALIALRGLPPLGYNSTEFPSEVVPLALIAVAFTFALSVALGLLWNPRRFALAAGLFWGVFFVLHTSFFQSMTGWATGLLQPLGFWLTQQEVKRIHVGPQYFLMLLSVYEPVSLLFGTLGVFYFAWKGLTRTGEVDEPTHPGFRQAQPGAPPAAAPGVATGLLAFWAPLALFLYSFAGEQTPWLNVHPALPFALLAATFLGRVVAARPEGTGLFWRWLRRGGHRLTHPRAGGGRRRAGRPGEGEFGPAPARLWADRATFLLGAGLLLWAGRAFFSHPADLFLWLVSAAILLGVAYLAFSGEGRGEAAFFLLGLTAIGMFVVEATSLSFGWPAENPQQSYGEWYALYVPLAVVTAALLVRALLVGKQSWRSAALLLLVFLCLYSFGSAFRLTYLNNDTPVEMLIYVQTSSDLQWAVDETSALSTLTTGGRDITVLYENEVAWPLEWYLRNYPRRALVGATVTPASLQQHPDAAVILTYRTFGSESTAFLEKDFAPSTGVASLHPYYAFNWWFPEEIYRNARTFVERLAPELLREHEDQVAAMERISFLLPSLFSRAYQAAQEVGRLSLGPAGPLLALLRPASFPSGYGLLGQARDVGLGDVFRVFLHPTGQARIWRYLLFRQIPSPLGAREFAVYIRRDLVLPLEWLKDDIPRR